MNAKNGRPNKHRGNFIRHPLLAGKLRLPPGVPCSGKHRWQQWAEQFSGRCFPFSANDPRPEMEFAKPAWFGLLLDRRWHLVSQQFLPRIRLMLQPVLREAAAGQKSPALVAGTWREIIKGPTLAAGARHEIIFRQKYLKPPASDREEKVKGKIPLSFTGQELRNVHGAGKSRKALEQRDEFNPLGEKNFAGMIFQPVAPDRKVPSSLPLHDAAQKKIQGLIHRIGNQTRRLEEGVPLATELVVGRRRGRMPPAVKETEEIFGPAMRVRGPQPPPGMNGWPQNQGPAALDMEALTDRVVQQIDKRLNAWRERLGKV